MNNELDIRKELHQNFLDYAYEVNSERAFPDARDGLKPGQRACLWEMFHKGYLPSKAHVKSAKISGGVIASWHPHGDVAVYETFVRMSQPWINNVAEVDFHGANGNLIIGSAPASARYTEARLAKVIEEGMFAGIKKKNVDMILNFSEDEEWPAVLPALFPRLMVNGSQGIGVTIAQTWLPHNLKEVGEAVLNYIKTDTIDYSTLAPDFPTGGIIINKNDFQDIYKTGKGKVILRGTTEVKGDSILIKELPYQVYVEPFIDSIKEEFKKETNIFKNIKDIYNKSDKKRMLIEIECAKGTAQQVLLSLFQNTDLQKNYNANQFALVSKTPKMLTFKEYIKIYIEHNLSCIQKEAEFDYAKSMARLEIVNGLLKALEDIDNIIALIKKSSSAATAREELQKVYSFTENQAKAIVDMKLGRLANLETIELNKEAKELNEEITNLKITIDSAERRIAIFMEKLSAFIKKYGTDRKTVLAEIEYKPESKETAGIAPEDVIVVVTKAGNTKRIPKASFRTQKKGGKGVKSENDIILTTIATNTIDNILFFTDKGKMYRALVNNIPEGTNVAGGGDISVLINLEPGEKVIAAMSLNQQNNKKYIVFLTTNGLIKKTALEEYTKTKKGTGMAAIKIKDGDSIADIKLMDEEDLILITKKGMSIKFSTKDIAPIGRVTSGIKGIKLNKDDSVLSGIVLESKVETIGFVSEKGYGKKVNVSDFTAQGKGGKGVIVYKELLAGAVGLQSNDNILLLGKKKSICISEIDLPLLGKIAVGNQIIKETEVNSIVRF